MAGDTRYLGVDEQIVTVDRRHVAVLLRPAGHALLAVVVSGVVGLVTSPEEGSDLIDTILGLVAILFAARLAWRIWEWWVDRIVVTDRRIFEASGIITRKVASMPLSKVTDMTYQRSLLGRLLGYGDFVVESPGQRQGIYRIDHLPRPDDFYRTVTSLVTAGSQQERREAATDLDDFDEDDTGPLPRVIV
jgi:uncharacterized membrane protein YdbT with pleckstrin-like domain